VHLELLELPEVLGLLELLGQYYSILEHLEVPGHLELLVLLADLQ